MSTYLVRSHLNKIVVIAQVLAFTLAAHASIISLSFDQLARNPGAYRGKEVSVIGVAEVDGTSFTLFQPPHRDVSHSIFIGVPVGPPRYDNLNNHWVRLTGVVEADEEGIFRAKIFMNRVEALHRSPVPEVKTYAIFTNQSSTNVQIELFDKSGKKTSKIILARGGIEKTAISDGNAKLLDQSGRLLSEITVESEHSKFLDPSNRSFYFRINDGKIERTMPRNASDIKARWDDLSKSERGKKKPGSGLNM
jgi:hypothetical protein